jgi:MoxR-like ATPase
VRFACQHAVDGIGWERHSGLVGRLRERERELAAVEVLLERHDGVLVLDGRAGIGKTSLVEAACSRADELGHDVVRVRGSERRLACAKDGEREALLAEPAAAARPLLSGELAVQPAGDSSFAVLHGLYGWWPTWRRASPADRRR